LKKIEAMKVKEINDFLFWKQISRINSWALRVEHRGARWNETNSYDLGFYAEYTFNKRLLEGPGRELAYGSLYVWVLVQRKARKKSKLNSYE